MDKFEMSYRFSQTSAMAAPGPMPITEPGAPSPVNTFASTSQPSKGQMVMLYLWLAFVVTACGASVGAHLMIGMNNDHLDLMDQVRRLLAGGTPYVAFADVNPPLIHILYTIPFTFSRLTGLRLDLALYGITLALIGFSLFASLRILTFSNVPSPTRSILLSSIALALLAISLIHQAFADRDHLIMVLVSPWLVLYSPLARHDAIPAKWRIMVAAMAAVGFAIKPHFYIFYLASIGFVFLAGMPLAVLVRQFEHSIIGGFALFYLCIIFLFFPAYPYSVLPLAWHTYGTMQWPWDSKMEVIRNDLCGYAIPGLACTLVLLLTSRAYYNDCITYLFTLLAAATGLYAMQGGWYYTQYPFIAIAMVMTAGTAATLLFACQRITPAPKRIFVWVAVSGLVAAGFGNYFATPVVSRAYWDIKSTQERGHPIENIQMQWKSLAKVEAHLATHPRFMFFTNDMRAVNLLHNGTPPENVGRFDYLWPMAGIFALGQDPAKKTLYEQMLASLSDAIADDLERYKPDMVINDVSPFQFNLPARFNVINYLENNPRFAKAWESYARVDSFETCNSHRPDNCAYEIYYRK